jgi:type VI secretion system secreted protein VgrG
MGTIDGRTLWLELDGTPHRPLWVRGRERISEPTRVEVALRIEGAIDPATLVEAPARLFWVDDADGIEAVVREVSGVVTECRLGATSALHPPLRIVVESRIALARQRIDIRVYRNRTVPEIVAEVLERLGIDIEVRIANDHPRHTYVVQSRESDLAFVSRLLESEGIHFRLDEADTVVIGDHAGAHEDIAGDAVPFVPRQALEGRTDAVIEIARRAAMMARRFSSRAFDPEHPDLDLDIVAEGEGPEVYDYPGGYSDPERGRERARNLGEAVDQAASVVSGVSSCPRFAVGASFCLVDCPDPTLDGFHMITGIDYDWRVDDEPFLLSFEARAEPATAPDVGGGLAVDVPGGSPHGGRAQRRGRSLTYRPAPRTPKPVLMDLMTATVVGPGDVHCDDQGRVKLRFHWDRGDLRGDANSDWVPVAQDNNAASTAVPRVGWEVLVGFLDGNPDKPVVLGRLYNGEDPFPWDLPDAKLVSALRSLTSPRGSSTQQSGTNFISFDDTAGVEAMTIHAERDQRVVVAHNKLEEILENESVSVGVDEETTVRGDHHATLLEDYVLTVARDQTWEVRGDRRQVAGTAINETVARNREHRIDGHHVRTLGTEDTVDAGALTERIGANSVEVSTTSQTLVGPAAGVVVVAGNLREVAADKEELGTETKVEKVGLHRIRRAAEHAGVTVRRGARAVDVGETFYAFANKEITLVGREIFSTHADEVTISADEKVTLAIGEDDKPPETTVVLEKDTITITVGGNVVVATHEFGTLDSRRVQLNPKLK